MLRSTNERDAISSLDDAHAAAGLSLHQVAAPADALWGEQRGEELEGEHDLQQGHTLAPAPGQRCPDASMSTPIISDSSFDRLQ